MERASTTAGARADEHPPAPTAPRAPRARILPAEAAPLLPASPSLLPGTTSAAEGPEHRHPNTVPRALKRPLKAMATWSETPLSQTWQLGAMAILLLVVFIDGQVLATTRGSLYIPPPTLTCTLLAAAGSAAAARRRSSEPDARRMVRDGRQQQHSRARQGVRRRHQCVWPRGDTRVRVHVRACLASGRGPKCAGDDGDGGVRAHR
jgi:hypothetical protein